MRLEIGILATAVIVCTAAITLHEAPVSALPTKEAEAQKEESYKPTEQAALNALVKSGKPKMAFTKAFEAGDELTEITFTAKEGVGANVGEGRLFTRFPRTDLRGKDEWASHLPQREGGPNATSCIACHNAPAANGAGDIAVNVVVDPAHTGDPAKFLERNTLPLFALGVPQKLAEEMSTELRAQMTVLEREACLSGSAQATLLAKGVSFGSAHVMRTSENPCALKFDWSKLKGIDSDLIVRAFGWKGNKATIRDFTRSAAHNELGLQAVEIIGDKDGDYDGVKNELSVGDLTALTIYMAGLERPVTKLELAELKLAKVTKEEEKEIRRGEVLFETTGCAGCHVPEMRLDRPMFQEPSATPGYHDVLFPSGDRPSDLELKRNLAIQLDLTADQPNNQIKLANGKVHRLGALRPTSNGGAIANWYTDFKRHDMGPELADPAGGQGIAPEMWLTRSLAGVGSTGPWLHDGRATTLDEAILAHGGDARKVRNNYAGLPKDDRNAIVSFLENLVIYKQEEAED